MRVQVSSCGPLLTLRSSEVEQTPEEGEVVGPKPTVTAIYDTIQLVSENTRRSLTRERRRQE
jgi:hypothetical protein